MARGNFFTRKFPNFIIVLVFTELWERFSYYCMGSILVLYMTNELRFEDEYAYAVNALYLAFANYLPIITGTLADRYFGFVNMLFIGGTINSIGHIVMFFSQFTNVLFYWSVSAVAVGTGFFRGNILNLLGACYDSDGNLDRVSGFTLFYAGVNVGAFFAAVISGYGAEYVSFHFAFSIAGVGMIIGLLVFFVYRKLYVGRDSIRMPEFLKKKYLNSITWPHILFIIAFLVVIPIAVFMYFSDIWAENNVIYYVVIPIALYTAYIFIWKAKNNRERKNLGVVLIHLVFLMIFFSFGSQLVSVFPVFVDRNVYKYIGPIPIPATVSLAINPTLIVIVGLLTSVLTTYNPKYDLFRIGYALISNSICFMILYWGILNANPETAETSYFYAIFGIVTMAIGEVIMSPLIQAVVTTYTPDGLRGAMMGLYMCFMGFASLSGFIFAKIFSVPQEEDGSISPFISIEIYKKGFYDVALYNLIFVAAFIVFIPILWYLKRPTEAEKQLKEQENVKFSNMV